MALQPTTKFKMKPAKAITTSSAVSKRKKARKNKI